MINSATNGNGQTQKNSSSTVGNTNLLPELQKNVGGHLGFCFGWLLCTFVRGFIGLNIHRPFFLLKVVF